MNLIKFIAVLSLTVVFPYLFYNHGVGVNLLIFNILLMGGMYFSGRLKFKGTLNLIVFAGTILTALFVVIVGSDFAIAINIVSLFLFAGITLLPNIRNLIYNSLLSVINFFYSQYSFGVLISELLSKSSKANRIKNIIKIIFIPIVVLVIFIIIYKAANPVFEGLLQSVFDAIDAFFTWLFEHIEIALIGTMILGFLIANNFILGEANEEIKNLETKSSYNLKEENLDTLEAGKYDRVVVQYKSAILLFSLLNVLILTINSIDIWWVWFNFTWDGEYLKQFVHEGTYLLILSILISLGICIYYFKGKINFLKDNLILKYLVYIWLFQNAILTVSVGIRNYWYINFFSLAYLRIGVIFFLLLTLYSIFTVAIKVKNKKSTYYLFSKNSLAAYIILVIMAFFNWDVIIAKYNFSHSSSSFIHYNFLWQLSDNALPYLDKSIEELEVIDEHQKREFPFTDQYLPSLTYHGNIQRKKKEFVQNWPKRGWQDWNWAGEKAYRDLISEKK